MAMTHAQEGAKIPRVRTWALAEVMHTAAEDRSVQEQEGCPCPQRAAEGRGYSCHPQEKQKCAKTTTLRGQLQPRLP